MLIVNDWYGRLGNNIIQISNVIDIALYYQDEISFNVNHTFFDLKIIENYFKKNNGIQKIIVKDDEYNFYYQYKCFPKEIFNKTNKEKINLMKKAFLIKNIDKLNENFLVIHIRSGDIFKYPHSKYVPPPISYYIEEISRKKYKKIIIVCEDRINPVVNELLRLYDNAVHSINTLNEDIRLILGATNIISSVGTFVSSLLMLSDNIKHHHGKDFENELLKDYYLIMKPWKNTTKQKNYIISYKYIEWYLMYNGIK